MNWTLPELSFIDTAVPSADAVVAAWEEDADPSCTELCKQVAHGGCIFHRKFLLVDTIRCVDRLWDVRLTQHVVEPREKHVIQGWLVAGERLMQPDAGAVVDVRVGYAIAVRAAC